MTEQPRRRRPYAPRVPLAERREQLLDAALRIINREGYGAVTVEGVSREAGVTKPVLYGVFENIAPLLTSLLERQTGRALGELFAALPADLPDLSGDEFLERTIRAWHHVVTTNPEVWAPILIRQQDIPPFVWEQIQHGKELVRQQIMAIITTQFDLADGMDPEILSHAFMGMSEHFGRLLIEEPALFDLDTMVRTFLALAAGIQRPVTSQ